MDTKTAAEKWKCNISDIREWCRSGRIEEAHKEKGRWIIPNDAKRPLDRRLQKEILWQILKYENNSVCRIDLTQWGIDDSSIPDYLSLLLPLCLRKRMSNNEPINNLSEIELTELGFAIVGYGRNSALSNQVPRIIGWSAQAAGIFAASFTTTMIQEQIGVA